MLLRRSRSEKSLFGSPESFKSTISRGSVSRNHGESNRSNDKKRMMSGRTVNNLRSWLSPAKKTTHCHRVQFSKKKPDVIPTLSREDFTLREFESYWVQPYEMKEFVDRNWNIIDAYEKSKKNKDAAFHLCTRGLESYIIERQRGKKIHSIKRKNAYTAVLLWGRGLSDDEMARRYQLVSKRCVKRAVEYARRDAITAAKILKEDTCLPLDGSERSQRSVGSLSTRSSIEIPCVPKRRNTWSGTSKKELNRRNKEVPTLRPCLKQVSGPIPQILPEIYVRSTLLATTERKKLASKHASFNKSKITIPSAKKANTTSPHLEYTQSRLIPHRNRNIPLSSLPPPPMLDEKDKNQIQKYRSGSHYDYSRPPILNEKKGDSCQEVVFQLTHGEFPMSPSAKSLTSTKVIRSKLKIDGNEKSTPLSTQCPISTIVKASEASTALHFKTDLLHDLVDKNNKST